jgi:hypothetical protein
MLGHAARDKGDISQAQIKSEVKSRPCRELCDKGGHPLDFFIGAVKSYAGFSMWRLSQCHAIQKF